MARWACVVVMLAGCYRAPLPACGFICGASSACPDGYTCNSDNRCHLDDTSVACDDAVDAGVSVVPPPKALVSFEPPRGATGVKTTDTVTVTFDVPVQNVDGSTFQLRSNGVAIDGIVIADGTPRKSTFVPSHLPSGSLVEGSLDPSITTIDKGESIGVQLWTFATEVDTTPPMVIAFVPGDGATNVSVSDGIAMGFDKDVANTSSISVTSSGVPVPGTWEYQVEAGSYSSFFQPATDQFPANATIEVSTTPRVCDYAGNPIIPFTAEFTTGPDTVPAYLIASVPSEHAIDVPTDIAIQLVFDEPVLIADPAGIVIVVFIADQAYVIPALTELVNGATITVTAALPAVAQITIYTEGVTDLAGNVSDNEVDFTTK